MLSLVLRFATLIVCVPSRTAVTVSKLSSKPGFYSCVKNGYCTFSTDGMDESLVAELTKLGHEMKKYDGNLSTVNVVGKINETVTAESDSRAGGKASIF